MGKKKGILICKGYCYWQFSIGGSGRMEFFVLYIVWHLQKSRPFYDKITFSIINTTFLINYDHSYFLEKKHSCFSFVVLCF